MGCCERPTSHSKKKVCATYLIDLHLWFAPLQENLEWERKIRWNDHVWYKYLNSYFITTLKTEYSECHWTVKFVTIFILKLPDYFSIQLEYTSDTQGNIPQVHIRQHWHLMIIFLCLNFLLSGKIDLIIKNWPSSVFQTRAWKKWPVAKVHVISKFIANPE